VYIPPNRFKNLLPGEVQLGNTVTQAYIKFNQDGTVEIKTNSNLIINANSAMVNATDTTVNGNVNLGGTGGQGVARIGDSVVDGVITSGSSSVKAV
jgi:hypothetical protein